jgi:sugar phosphate isomerase/epimerase
VSSLKTRIISVTNVKIGIQTRSLRQPLRQALHTAARLGAQGVEIDVRNELPAGELSRTGLREFHKLLDDLNLRVAAVAFPTRRGYDVPDDLERRVQATHAAMRFAHELHTNVVINRPGHVPADASDPAYRRMVEALTAIGTFGDRVGTRLALQTGGERPQSLASLIEALPEQTVGADLHPISLILSGSTPSEALDVLGPHVLHVHACDAVRDAAGRGHEVELGRGTADVAELLGRLTEFDYRGWVTVERHDSPDPVSDIEDAVAYLRAL